MAKLTYPKKPWTDGQKAYLMTGLQFIYSLSLRKWVPITPGSTDEEQIQAAFGVRTAEEVDQLFINVDQLKSDVIEFGRIWKTQQQPPASDVHTNDVWIDPQTGRLLYYTTGDTWVEITY